MKKIKYVPKKYVPKKYLIFETYINYNTFLVHCFADLTKEPLERQNGLLLSLSEIIEQMIQENIKKLKERDNAKM